MHGQRGPTLCVTQGMVRAGTYQRADIPSSPWMNPTRERALCSGQEDVRQAGHRLGTGHASLGVNLPAVNDQAHAGIQHAHSSATVAHCDPRPALALSADRHHGGSHLQAIVPLVNNHAAPVKLRTHRAQGLSGEGAL